jgi:uncharacterized repeat protein (TIGR03803 family)
MNQDSFASLCIINYKKDNILTAVMAVKYSIKHLLNKHGVLIHLLLLIMLATGLKGQETLMGLTSNGGTEGRGTVFTIKTNATAFSILKAFPDWGKTPWGDLLKGDDGNFYGMTNGGGTFNYGTIFRATPAGIVTVLRNLNYATDGANPYGELIKGADGSLYGFTSVGGTSGYGTIFKITTAGTFTVIKHLVSANGTNPRGHLVIGADGNFYGATYAGGANGYGTIFKMTPAGILTVLHSLSSTADGANCYGSLVKGTDNNFYGTTNGGGTTGQGTIFKITPAGVYTVLRQMNQATDGSHSQSDLIQATDGNFYGMAYSGGPNFSGTIFKITSTGTFTVLRSLVSANGINPYGSLLQGTDGNFYGTTSSGGTSAGGTIFKITPTGTLTVLRALLATADGGNPRGSLVRGNDGNYYGLTNNGGSNFFGTLFKISATGTFTVLTRLNGDLIGNAPYESLIQATDVAYYGTTLNGGINDQGTVFKICGGVYTVLHSFKTTTEGGLPKGSLVQASDGNLYGITSTGGTSNSGTIFKITTAGVFSVLHHLVNGSEGSLAQGSLIQGADSYLYGVTSSGGTGGTGTIFKITTAGAFKVIRQLVAATDGSSPEGNLVKGAGGADSFFYGTTKSRIFKISPNGKIFTILRTLNAATDGNNPLGSLVRATDGNFYGTNSNGGTISNSGTIFKITSTGVFTLLRNLNSSIDGGTPKGNLIQAADGFLYGLTSAGGTNNAGTIFKISTAGAFTVLRQLNLLTDGGTAFGSLIIQKTTGLTANPQAVSTAEDISKAIVLTGSGGSPLTFSISTNPKNGSVTGTGANWTYKSVTNYNGKDSFYFTANVGCAASAPAKINITITPVNDTPVLATVGNKTIKTGSLLTFTAAATDVDAGQTKTFSLITAPSGATINSATGIFNWTPAATGSFTFKIRVTDNGVPVLFDEEQITVTVTATLVAKPSFTAMPQPEGTLSKTGIYPNPARDQLTVMLDQPVSGISGILTSVNGAIIKKISYQTVNAGKLEINISGIVPGTYLLKLNSGTNKWVFKFLKL